MLGAGVAIAEVTGRSRCLDIRVVYASLRRSYTQVTLASEGVVQY